MIRQSRFAFETGIYRPPSEGGSSSLLVRLTRNCPWNRCTFCAMYKTERFALRPVEEIKADIDAMAALYHELERRSQAIGRGAVADHGALLSLLRDYPELNQHTGLAMLYEWRSAGGRTAFLQDANSLIMKTEQLIEALRYLRAAFPSLKRVTSYARSRTLMQKSAAELAQIRAAGLDRLHVGLESGDDQVLQRVNKGVRAADHISGGRKAVAAGFELSAYWMPGLGGKDLWPLHAQNTAAVLNAIDPHYIRSRPFHPLPGTALTAQIAAGDFTMLSAQEQLLEIKQTITALQVNGRVCFDHAGNYWRDRHGRQLLRHDYEGYQFPRQKDEVLARIEEGLVVATRRPEFLSL